MSGPRQLACRVVLEGVQSAKRKRMLGVEAYDTDSDDERKEAAAETTAYAASFIDPCPGRMPGVPLLWRQPKPKRVKNSAEIAIDEVEEQKRERQKERERKAWKRARKEVGNPSPPKKKRIPKAS